MKVSVNSIRFANQHYSSAGDPAPDGIDALVQKIGAQLGAVEEVIPYGERFKGVIVAKVVSCQDHPNADRLHVCKVDDGGTAENVERDEQGNVQVVCGAPNVREGLAVAWLPPGTTVPSTLNSDPFVLEARELRGVVSNGMLASPKELTIGDSHEGILELDTDAAPGTTFAEAYNLVDDVVIDMENKMFTHRPDCFGQLGIARELEGIQRRPYKSPEWYTLEPVFPDTEAEELKLEVRNELPDLVPRFTAITMRDVAVKESPVWLQIALSKAGIRPINNIVDYTNFFMLETGQPLHAYDYDKVKAMDANAEHATIVVRHPKQGEKITLLNGREIEPRDEAIMIASRGKLIGVGGIMGGGETEVDETTTNIILECANFDMYSIRRTSMAHGLFTDAVTRFNKGQSPLQNLAVLAKIVDEIRSFADGKVAGTPVDVNYLDAAMLGRGSVHPATILTRLFINERLGFDLSTDAISELLRNVEFEVTADGDQLTVQAPFWRTDIAIAEDVVEEVGRLYGFDHLPLELPKRDLTPVQRDVLLACKARARDALSKNGANELLTYGFVHGNLLDKVGQDKKQAFQLSNALSPDLQYIRMSLTPSLLDRVHPNIKAGYTNFALFELNTTYPFGNKEYDDDGLPRESSQAGLVFAADAKAATAFAGAPYYQARNYLTDLLASFGMMGFVTFEPLADADLQGNAAIQQLVAPYEPGRSAVLRDGQGQVWGVVGEYRAAVKRALKLPDFCAGFELDLLLLLQPAETSGYIPMPRFPKVEQDICLKVPASTPYGVVFDFVWSHLDEHRPDQTFHQLGPVDIYQPEGDSTHKQITLRLSIASFERTLTAEEVNGLLDHVAEAAKAQLDAERV